VEEESKASVERGERVTPSRSTMEKPQQRHVALRRRRRRLVALRRRRRGRRKTRWWRRMSQHSATA
jgi:hypothetical protein